VFFLLNIHGQNTYIGRIIEQNVSSRPPAQMVYILETAFSSHILTLNTLPITVANGLIVDNIEYSFDDIVEITGYLISGGLEIETIKKWSPNQDIQRFLGEYHLEGTCKVLAPWQDEVPVEKYVIIETGIESDLLISNVGFAQSEFNIFILNDNLFIPLQWGGIVWEHPESFRGEGQLKNDTLFMHFGSGGELGILECECQGKKIGSTNVVSLSEPNKNKVYFDAIKQVIVIDETLQNQSLIFELIDLQGKVILKQTNIGNTSICIANLSDGVYLYRLFLNDQEIYVGKILKN